MGSLRNYARVSLITRASFTRHLAFARSRSTTHRLVTVAVVINIPSRRGGSRGWSLPLVCIGRLLGG